MSIVAQIFRKNKAPVRFGQSAQNSLTFCAKEVFLKRMTVKIVCSYCEKEITPDQQKGGFFNDDPKAWDWVRGFYHAEPKHRQCGWKGLIKEWRENGVDITFISP